MLPYGKQTIDQADIAAVLTALSSPMLTCGPMVETFEQEFATATGSTHAVSLSSGTAALHAVMNAINIAPGDEVIVPAITFVATANAVVYCGGKPIFADVEPDTLLVDLADIEKKITPQTKAIVAVDYAGQPCDYQRLRALADRHGLYLIADSCHSLGGSYQNQPVGSLADLTCFSFHPVKQITTCEGGMVTTENEGFADRIRQFRSHGIDATATSRSHNNTHQYDMQWLGFNYRLSDLQCALGLSQLKKLSDFVLRRQAIAAAYQAQLASLPSANWLTDHSDRSHGRHLVVIKWEDRDRNTSRDQLFEHMRRSGINVNVHYRPVYQNSFYTDQFGQNNSCPNADTVYQQILSLPVFPTMTDSQIDTVCSRIAEFSRQQTRYTVAAA